MFGEIGKKYQKQKLWVKFIGFLVGSMMDILKYPCRLLSSKGVHYSEVNRFYRDRLRTKVFLLRWFKVHKSYVPCLLEAHQTVINTYQESWKRNSTKRMLMFGTSPVNQETADKLIVQLFKVNGLRFSFC
jgi:hypothetical protein